jgi:uncharacterized protein (UPF0335 family)
MNQIDIVRARLEEVAQEIQFLEMEQDQLEALLADLTADASGNSHWGPAGPLGERAYLPFLDIYEKFSTSSDRAERIFANTFGKRHGGGNLLTNTYIVSMTPEGDSEMMEVYSDAQNRGFGMAILGKTFQLSKLAEDDTVRIPLWINHMPSQAREFFEEMYSVEGLEEKLRNDALRLTKSLDFYYKMASWGNSTAEFLAENPGYETPQ